MRLALLADVHANRAALDAVLADIARRGADQIVCVGDIVGYGPDPEACVGALRDRDVLSVLGNHDLAVASGRDLDALPRDGQVAALRHREWLSADDLAWLSALPLRAAVATVTLVHASPDAPAAWNRLEGFHEVHAQFAAFDTDVCVVGHSHRPAVVADRLGVTTVRPGHRYLINVGSVGQPRDHDPRAAYGLFDTEAVAYELIRVYYDHTRTAARLRERGLPAGLGTRLARGV